MALAFSVSINVLEVDYHNNQLAHPELGVFPLPSAFGNQMGDLYEDYTRP